MTKSARGGYKPPILKTEANIQAMSLITASSMDGVFIYRNNVGKYRSLDGNRVLNIGVVGSSDALGCVKVKIDESWIGKEVGIFFCAEYKTKQGKQRPEQVRFQAKMESLGVPYRIIRSPDEMKDFIKDIKSGSGH